MLKLTVNEQKFQGGFGTGLKISIDGQHDTTVAI